MWIRCMSARIPASLSTTQEERRVFPRSVGVLEARRWGGAPACKDTIDFT